MEIKKNNDLKNFARGNALFELNLPGLFATKGGNDGSPPYIRPVDTGQGTKGGPGIVIRGGVSSVVKK